MIGTVLALHAGPSGFVKEARERLAVDAGGAVGDRHHGRRESRALLMVPEAAYAHLRDEGIDLAYGSLGENLVVSGLPAASLEPGTRLRLGAVTAVVTGPCTVCRSLANVHPRLPKVAFGRRGDYLRVEGPGVLHRDDLVALAGRAPRGEDSPAPSADARTGARP